MVGTSTDLPGEAPLGTYKVSTGDGKPVSAHEAIFPLVSRDNDGMFSLIGTGFFIAENGVFATAAHVVAGSLYARGNPKSPLGLFQFLPGNQYLYRPVHRAVLHTRADVAVGVAWPARHNETGASPPNKLLTLSSRTARIALSISTYAYPKTTIRASTPQLLNFGGAFFDGIIQERFPQGRDRVMLPGPCFRTSMVLHGGASGGPVLGANGTVVAIN